MSFLVSGLTSAQGAHVVAKFFGVYVMSECTALLGQELDYKGALDSGFSSCTVPTYYCRSEYFYNQHLSSEFNWN